MKKLNKKTIVAIAMLVVLASGNALADKPTEIIVDDSTLPGSAEKAETVEITPLWSRFVSARINKMPNEVELREAIQDGLATCDGRIIMCNGVASGAEEQPNCDAKLKRWLRAQNRGKTESSKEYKEYRTCVNINQELAKDRIRTCRRAVEVNEGHLPPGQGVGDEIRHFLQLGVGGDNGRGAILTCYKQSFEYVRAQVGAMDKELGGIRASVDGMNDPEKEGSLSWRLKIAEGKNDDLEKKLARLEELLNSSSRQDHSGAFNVFRVSADFRLIADTRTTGRPAIGLDIRVGFDVPLGVNYESYITAGYVGGAAKKGDGSLGVAQGASLQWRFPVTLLPEHRVFIWAGPELFALALQDDFRTSREILVGGGAALGFEWHALNAQFMAAGANYGDRSDGTVGAAFVFSAMFGINIPLDPIGVKDRRDARKRQQDRYDALHAAHDAAPPPS